ncbi:MAG: hypothetical protein AAF495_09230 [Pseudomonadota bacterium]
MFSLPKTLAAGAAALFAATASPAVALEPANASDIVALWANQSPLTDDCPYLTYSSGVFVEIGPDSDFSQPFVVPPGYVFVATSFHWRANGGPDDLAVPGALTLASVRVGLGGPAPLAKKVLDEVDPFPTFPLPDNGREDDEVQHYGAIMSSAIAGVDGIAGTTINFPTGVVLRPFEGGPICLGLQQGNEHLIGNAYLNGYLAPDT